MKFAVNGLAFLRFMDSGGEPSGDADEGRLGGREGGGEPGAGVGFPEVFKGVEGKGGLIGVGVVEGALLYTGALADRVDCDASVALLPHQVAESGLEFFRSI